MLQKLNVKKEMYDMPRLHNFSNHAKRIIKRKFNQDI